MSRSRYRRPIDWTLISDMLEIPGKINPDTSAFHLVNVSIILLKVEYGAFSESQCAYYSRCHVTWCAASQRPSTREAVPVTATSHIWYRRVAMWENNFNTMKYMNNASTELIEGKTLLLVPIIGRFSLKRRKCLVWTVLWHSFAFIAYKTTWRRASIILLSQTAMKKWCLFSPKPHSHITI